MSLFILPLFLGTLAQLPSSAEARPISMAGIVMDHSGRVLEQADVWLTRATGPEDDRKSARELSWRLETADAESNRVFAGARTDSGGGFRLDVPSEITARADPVALAIWAIHRTGHVSAVRLPRVILPGDPPIRIKLGPPVRCELILVGPDGQPIPEASLVATRVLDMPVPEPLSEKLVGTSDRIGKVIVPGVARSALSEVRVDARGFGVQRVALTGDERASVQLAPVGRVVGRLMTPEHREQPITGVKARVRSTVGGFEGSGIRGEAEVACDATGRFEIPAIAAGLLKIDLVFDPEKGGSLRGEAPGGLVLAQGSTVEVSIPLRPTVRFRGLVREKESKRPIPGVGLVINGHLGGDRLAISDALGSYGALVVRENNQPYGWPIRIPRPFYQPQGAAEVPQRMPSRDRSEVSLPPLELARGVDLAGAVTDNAGKPVADAEVESVAGEIMLTRTDSLGRFVLSGVDPLEELKIVARRGAMDSGQLALIRAGNMAAASVKLTLGQGRTGRLSGRVIDRAGRLIAGASVRIWRQVRGEGLILVQEPVSDEDGKPLIRTDSQGRFHSPRPLPLGDEYIVDARAPLRFSERSAALTLTGGDQNVPDIVLLGLRDVMGQIVDREGRPIVGVRLTQAGDGPLRTEARTDEAGQFRLPGVVDGPAFVFASKEGFRFQSQSIDDSRLPVKIVLARCDEPPARSLAGLSPTLPIAEEKALARRLLLPYAERVLARGSDQEKFQLFRDAIQVDPAAVLERLATLKFNALDLLKLGRVELVEVLAKESVDEALEQTESSPDPEVRAFGYLGICDVRPDLEKARVREFVDQALVNSRAIKSTEYRVMALARIADRLIDLGEKEQARKTLQDAEALARPTSKGNQTAFTRELQVAEVLARVDLPAALRLMEESIQEVRKKDRTDRTYVFARIYGQIAFKLAADAPADAERMLERSRGLEPTHVAWYLAAVCSKMASKDPARARHIAETMADAGSINQGPYALGLIAQKLAGTDKAEAVRLLEIAYDKLDRQTGLGETTSYNSSTVVAAGLLPIVEEVAPERLVECLARTLSLREPWMEGRDLAENAQQTACLVMVLAQYDRELATRLLRPEVDRLGQLRTLHMRDFISWRVLAALALVDPREAVERIEKLPDDKVPGIDTNSAKQWAITETAKLLAQHGKDRWKQIFERFLYLWMPGQRYL
jgi:hypothetical protein